MPTQLVTHTPDGVVCAALQDGVHAGKAIVGGASWDGPVTSEGWCILDLADDPATVRQSICSAMLTASDISKAYDYFAVNDTRLPTTAQASLASTGRASITTEELLAALGFAPDWSAGLVQSVEQEQGTWTD
jgi:hypothetical protein